MNRKFILLALCASIGLAALFVFASRPVGKKSVPADQSVVITPDGKVTVTPPRNPWTITMDQSKTKTNTTNSRGK